MAKADLDKSQLDRSLLGDLSALIGVLNFAKSTNNVDLAMAVRRDIDSLIGELWPTG